MVFIVLLVAVAVITIGGAIANSLYRRRVVSSLADPSALPGTEGLPSDASITSGELGRAVGKAYLDQSAGGWGF